MRVLGMLIGCAVVLGALASAGEKLEVGPGKKFEKVAAALKAAKDGDTIEIDVKGTYEKDVGYVKANNLTIRGVGEGRAVLDAQGTCAGSKGIFVIQGKDTTVENIEFRKAGGEVNAAGIRAEGENLTVRNCKFFECRDALLGGKGEVLIEFSEFSHCGHNADPATHNLYISQNVTKLTYRYNYSHYTYEGHLLKTRAKESWILYNRLSDEDGTGSAVADFPNGGVVVLVGNILHKGAKGQNNRPIAYGMEGIKHEKNALYVINNTIVWENRRPQEVGFVHVKNAPEGFSAVIRNNLCIGPLRLTTSPKFEESGNLIFKTAAEAGLADPEKFDFRLKTGSPAVDKGVDPGKFGEFSLAPEFQYLHPARSEKRPADGKLDVGAWEWSSPK
jgi:hypothetical protein